MLLFWILLAIVIGVGESISDSYKAAQFKKSGGMENLYPHTFKKK